MAKGMYTPAREEFAKGNISWTSATIKAILVKSTYTQNLTTDNFLDDISAGNRIGSAVTLTTKTATNGAMSCDPVTFTSVAGGNTVAAVVFYKDTGAEATSNLIAYIGEDSGGTPYALATNGSNVVYTPHASGVCSI